ncbi:MAG: hypothetical protein NVS2B12_31320 [Ktedonobacteraceae bacterium]
MAHLIYKEPGGPTDTVLDGRHADRDYRGGGPTDTVLGGRHVDRGYREGGPTDTVLDGRPVDRDCRVDSRYYAAHLCRVL